MLSFFFITFYRMVKRYYCDFCDRSFPYSVEGRKKHYNGFQHQQQRTAHYDTFKSKSLELHTFMKSESATTHTSFMLAVILAEDCCIICTRIFTFFIFRVHRVGGILRRKISVVKILNVCENIMMLLHYMIIIVIDR